MGLGSPTSAPASPSISTTRVRAWVTVRPSISPYDRAAATGSSDAHPSSPHGTARSRPLRPTMVRVGRASSRHHVTSVVSPKVQIMAMPEPLSGSASGCTSTGTRTWYSGVITSWPTTSR